MSTRSLHGRTILLVDDDRDGQAALEDLLSAAGARVLTATNGIEALEVLKRRGPKPEAMLVDLDMPLMDGRTFCEECDKEPELAAIPRVLLTGNPYATFFHSNARKVLGKPIDPSKVLEALSTVCEVRAVAA